MVWKTIKAWFNSKSLKDEFLEILEREEEKQVNKVTDIKKKPRKTPNSRSKKK